MKLYLNSLSPNSRKVSAVARHLELAVEEVQVDLFNGAHKTPDFMAINPNGLVPALLDEDVKLWESNAIMGYLASKRDNTLWPKTNARYDIMRWQYWQLAHFGPACDVFTLENLLKPMRGGSPDQERLKKGAEDFGKLAKILETQLDGRKFVTGDTLTLADFALAAPLTYAEKVKIPLDDFAHIKAWRARLDEVPAWRATVPQM